MEPSRVDCALLVNDTVVEILPSAPPIYNRSITTPATDNSASTWWGFRSLFGKHNGNDKRLSDTSYGSGSGGSLSNDGYSGGIDSGSNSGSKSDSDYCSGSSGANSNSGSIDSDSISGNSSNHNSEVTSPVSATSTPPSPSPIYWDNIGTTMINWFTNNYISQVVKNSVDVQGSTADSLPNDNNVTKAPKGFVKSRHKKQTSWPIPIGKLLPESIETPPLNVILRVQPCVHMVISFQNDVEQLDVFVHPSTFPTLYMRRHVGQEASSSGYLVKLQMVTFPEKPNKKHTKSEQDDENPSPAQTSSLEDKGVIKAVVVRLCFVSAYHLSNDQESSTDLVNIKPGHIVISDCVRQQLGIRDFSLVRLTQITNRMRIPCDGHSIKLTPLNNEVSK